MLTVAEASELARRHAVTVRRALEAGELHGYQRVARGRWLIDRGCLERWIRGEICEHRMRLRRDRH